MYNQSGGGGFGGSPYPGGGTYLGGGEGGGSLFSGGPCGGLQGGQHSPSGGGYGGSLNHQSHQGSGLGGYGMGQMGGAPGSGSGMGMFGGSGGSQPLMRGPPSGGPCGQYYPQGGVDPSYTPFKNQPPRRSTGCGGGGKGYPDSDLLDGCGYSGFLGMDGGSGLGGGGGYGGGPGPGYGGCGLGGPSGPGGLGGPGGPGGPCGPGKGGKPRSPGIGGPMGCPMGGPMGGPMFGPMGGPMGGPMSGGPMGGLDRMGGMDMDLSMDRMMDRMVRDSLRGPGKGDSKGGKMMDEGFEGGFGGLGPKRGPLGPGGPGKGGKMDKGASTGMLKGLGKFGGGPGGPCGPGGMEGGMKGKVSLLNFDRPPLPVMGKSSGGGLSGFVKDPMGMSKAKGGSMGGKKGAPFGGCAANATPMNHSNLFVGNLADHATESTMRDAFSPYGMVASCRFFTRNGRTCALVKMGNVEQASRVCAAVQRGEIGEPASNWLVKFADSDVSTKGELGGKPGEKGGKGGFGGATFGKGAFLGLDGMKGGGGGEGTATRPPRSFENKQTEPSENLYVKGLPPSITEGVLQTAFGKIGKVAELKILRYTDSQEWAALIRMDSLESATAAINQLNGKTLEGALPPLTITYHGKTAPATPSDNVYVKGLPLTITQDQLRNLFSAAGEVKRCRVIQTTGTFAASNAVALVQMSSSAEAEKAIQMFNNKVPEGLGPQMSIRYAEPKTFTDTKTEPSDNLYIKGLPLGTPEFLLRAVFVQFGNVVRLKVLEPRGNEAHDCAALVQMSSVEEATKAIDALHGRVLAAPTPVMRVRYAGKDQEASTNLYVAGLSTTTTEQQLHATFAAAGLVVRARLLVDPTKPETHALVQMGSVEEAKKAIDMLNNKQPESFGPTLLVRYAADRQEREKVAAEEGVNSSPAANVPSAPQKGSSLYMGGQMDEGDAGEDSLGSMPMPDFADHNQMDAL